MPSKTTPTRIGIIGSDGITKQVRHGCGLWMAGCAACLTAAEAESVPLNDLGSRRWDRLLDGLGGVLIVGSDHNSSFSQLDAEALCLWCRENKFPLLGVDHGLHTMNTAFGGTMYQDVSRELPEALQHKHPPERGLRHAINVLLETRMCDIYGEGEIVVNSEHRRAIQRLARGFRVGAHALDGVVEAIEAIDEEWFAVGVQWHPASTTASGLDIQLFRALVQAAHNHSELQPA